MNEGSLDFIIEHKSVVDIYYRNDGRMQTIRDSPNNINTLFRNSIPLNKNFFCFFFVFGLFIYKSLTYGYIIYVYVHGYSTTQLFRFYTYM